MFGQRETVGHPGDEVADPPRPLGLGFSNVCGRQPFGGHGGRVALIARKEIEYELFGILHHPHHPFVPVHSQLQECLDRGFRFRHFGWKRDQRLALVANVVGRRRPYPLQSAVRFQNHRADQMGNQFAHDFGAAPAFVETRIAGVDFRDYINRLLAALKRNWEAVMPESARMGDRGVVFTTFSINPDGSVSSPDPALERTSGKEPLDNAAMSAIHASNPFEPLPKQFHGPYLKLRIVFIYNIPPEQVNLH